VVFWAWISGGCTAACTLIVTAIMLVRRRAPVIKAASITHSMVVLGGILCLCVSAVSWVMFPSHTTCRLRMLLLFEGLSLIAASLYTKLSTVARIMNSKRTVSMKEHRMSFSLPSALVFVVWDLVVMGVWFVLSNRDTGPTVNDYAQPVMWTDELLTDVLPVCRTFVYKPYLFVSLLLFWKVLFIAWGAVTSIITRDVINAFNESRSLRFGVFVMMLIILVGLESFMLLPLHSATLACGFLTLVLAGTLLVVLFGNKLYYLFKYKGIDPVDLMPRTVNALHQFPIPSPISGAVISSIPPPIGRTDPVSSLLEAEGQVPPLGVQPTPVSAAASEERSFSGSVDSPRERERGAEGSTRGPVRRVPVWDELSDSIPYPEGERDAV
ncbi:hypothetical protein KIPB_006407, partial [Kipferlia bialata]